MDAEKLKYMSQIKNVFIEHLENELKVAEAALSGYEKLMNDVTNQEADSEIKKMREIECIILRNRINFIRSTIQIFKLIK